MKADAGAWLLGRDCMVANHAARASSPFGQYLRVSAAMTTDYRKHNVEAKERDAKRKPAGSKKADLMVRLSRSIPLLAVARYLFVALAELEVSYAKCQGRIWFLSTGQRADSVSPAGREGHPETPGVRRWAGSRHLH
jgi:hypothetical protein